MKKQLVLFVSAIAVLGIFCGCSKREQQANPTPSPATNAAAILDPELKRILEERVQLARSLLNIEQKKMENGKSTPEEVSRSLSRVIEAQLALASAPQEEIPLREQQVALAQQAEEQMKKKIEVGAAAPMDELLARYERLTAECDLLKAKRRLNQK